MNCRQCRKWWSPYLDSELDAATTFEVSEHLRTCADCRERFERESFVEQWMRDWLRGEAMPGELWGAICDEVRSRPQRVIRFPLRQVLAVAASIALIAIAGVYYTDYRRGGEDLGGTHVIEASRQSVVDILQDRNPQLVPFADVPVDDVRTRLQELSTEMLNAQVDILPESSGGHPIELVSVSRQTDRSGKEYLEVRLNCCQRPVLLVMARKGCENCIPELRCATQNCRKKCKSACPKAPPIEMESQEFNGVMVAAATADHYLRGIFSAVTVTPI